MTVEEFLTSHHVNFIAHEHPAVFTCEEAEKYCSNIPGTPAKNLLLRNDKSTRFVLVILPADKRLDLKKLGPIIGEKHLSFANPQKLLELLGLTPGAVSPFGLINDQNNQVEVFVDQDIYDASVLNFHPNRNTASLEISGKMFHKFLESTNHRVKVVGL